MSAAETAPKTEANADVLRRLHPQEPPVPNRNPTPIAAPPTVSRRQVRGCLRSFSLGSSGGLSLLTPAHVIDACSTPGSQVLDSLALTASMAMVGKIPQPVRPFFYGARLVGLAKKGGGLRPVAAGDVLRRVAGRLLCKAVAEDARKFFLARTQVGVAVEGGADAAIAACRDIARTLPPDHVIVKIDQRNAFNSVLRSHMLDIIGARFPVLYPYARAAYGTHSRLYFGPHVIESQRGVQQGCPLGPLFFSLVMAEAREAARVALRDAGFAEQQITFEAWFLDDGTFAGSAAAAEAYVNALEQACAAYGLEFNRAKCEVILPADGGCGLPEGSFRDFQRLSADNFELLGVPCGDDASVQRTCERLAERVCERIARIGQLYDPQVVYALLRHCGGFPLPLPRMARAAAVCRVVLLRARASAGRHPLFLQSRDNVLEAHLVKGRARHVVHLGQLVGKPHGEETRRCHLCRGNGLEDRTAAGWTNGHVDAVAVDARRLQVALVSQLVLRGPAFAGGAAALGVGLKAFAPAHLHGRPLHAARLDDRCAQLIPARAAADDRIIAAALESGADVCARQI